MPIPNLRHMMNSIDFETHEKRVAAYYDQRAYTKEHPLARAGLDTGAFRFDKWEQGYATYKMVNNKFSQEMSLGERVPLQHLYMWYRLLRPITYDGFPNGPESKLAILFWLRRHTRNDLTDAIATLSMLHACPIVLLRSFSKS